MSQIRAALLVGLLGMWAGLARAQASHPHQVPAGPLNQAIGRFASQAGVFVSADGALTAGKTSPGLDGSFTTVEGFRRLLAGSGLQALRAEDGTYVLRPAPAEREAGVVAGTAVLPPVQVSERAESAALPRPTAGSRAADGAQNLPRSVGVLGRSALDLLGASDLQEALQHTPGVTTTNVDNSRYRVYSRGFQIDTLQFDGVSSVVGYLTPPNLSMYESVEVLRGPDGVMAGVGSAGGTMNLVRKRPQQSFGATVQAGAGSYDSRSGLADIGGPLNAAGTLRGRLVASSDHESLRQQGTFRHDDQLYGVLEADIAPATTLRTGASRQWMTSRSMQYGYPTYTDGSFLRVSPSTYYGADWNRESYRLDTAFGELEHRLDGDWSVHGSVNLLHSSRDTAFAGLRGAVDAGQDLTRYQTSTTLSRDRQAIFDIKATGPLTAFGRRHTLTAGVGAIDQHSPQAGAPGDPRTVAVSLDAPFSPLPANFDANLSRQVTDTRQLGAYAQGRFSLADPLDLSAGVRASRWTSSVSADPDANAAKVQDHHDAFGLHLTPSAALVLRLGPQSQVYAAMSDIFTPQSQRDAAGQLLEPLQGRQQEVGLKQALADGRALLSLALFRVVQANRAMVAPGDSTGTVFVAQGKARTQGLDMQLNGLVAPGWDVSLGYTRTLARALDSSADTGKSAFSAYTPAHLLKAWTDWRPYGSWHLGGALKASSAYQVQDTSATVRQPGLATVDAWVGVDLRHGVQLSARLENVFDRLYYQSLSSTADHNFLGNPRKLMLTLRTMF